MISPKKITNYLLNSLLVIIVIILLVPSWRISFQGWFHGLFMSKAEFTKSIVKKINPEQQNWALFDLNSQLINFYDFKGKPILLSFWATWCPPCRAELPELKSLNHLFAEQIYVVAVTEETIFEIENSGLNNNYDFLYSTPGIPDYFSVSAFPTLLIINKNMEIIYRQEGAAKLNTEKNRQFLNHLIQE